MALGRNQQVAKLNEKWRRVLSKLKHGELPIDQGIELLNSIERRLDKVDLEGLAGRLTAKY